MNCQECLEELATGSLRDLQIDSPVMQHCAICPDCGPLATALREREYTAATVLNSLPPMSNPITIAQQAGVVARRRRLGKIAVFASGIALAATVWISAVLTETGRRMFEIDDAPNLYTETIRLHCLSPDQAGELIEPYLREPGRIYYASKSGVSAITVRGSRRDIATAREMIREFEGDPHASCNSLSTKIKEVEDAVRRAAEERAASEGGRSADLVPSGVVEPTPPVEPNPANPINRRKK